MARRKSPLKAHDIARVQVLTYLSQMTIRKALRGEGSETSRARVRDACKALGLVEPDELQEAS